MTYHPGDLVFCNGTGFLSRAIRLAEWLRFRKGSKFNHVAILYKPYSSSDGIAAGGWTVIQAEARGVTCTKTLDDLRKKGDTFTVVHTDCLAEKIVDFAHGEVGRKYGFLTIISVLVSLFTPKFVNVMLPNTWICSALAGEALRAGGWVHSWPDVYQVNPAELWEALQ